MAAEIELSTPSLIAVIEPAGFTVDWGPGAAGTASDAERDLLAAFGTDPYGTLLNLGFRHDLTTWSESVTFLVELAQAYVAQLARTEELAQERDRVTVVLSDATRERLLSAMPFLIGGEHVGSDWIAQVWEHLHHAFQSAIRDYEGSVDEFFAARGADLRPLGRIYFHLVESKDSEAPFAFLATYAPDAANARRHLPLKNALVQYQGQRRQLLDLLSTVTRAASESAWVAGLLESGEVFQPLRLSAAEAYTFLKEIPLYQRAGILCRVPKWWRSGDNRLTVRASMGSNQPSRLGIDALLDFRAEIALGGERLTAEEVRQLLAETEGLAYIKGKWIEVDHDQLRKILDAYENAQKQRTVSLVDALRFELYRGAGGNVNETWEAVEVTHGAWLSQFLESLTEPKANKPLDFGGHLVARLRPYQERGVEWLAHMRQWGLGACLADDMGLGKTLQVLAFLTALRQEGPLQALLVVPASLLGNWMDEMTKFTPELIARVAHPSVAGPDELADSGFGDGADVVLTTYGLVERYSWISQASWDVLILDEAQAIKNPGAKQSRAVKRIPARFRVALTGTPIENRLSDLWSLFDFLNRGLMGTAGEFGQFIKALGQHPEGYAPLRRMAAPFILRRVKTDKSVISDLPDKIEVKVRAELTRRQAALYGQVVADLEGKIERLAGMERKGLILASLMKLKQICNHPDQFLGQPGFDAGESGKFQRLGELAEMIYQKRERVLVFTQFREMTEPLARFLESVFQHPGLVLHGQTPVAKRKHIVSAFQGSAYVPFMVLSLKAGGVGLNLTQASHVIHFDRWWNPAVENQATDRAFRIGQTKNVLVHKFVTQGTIEEKIEALIQDKQYLSQEVIATQQDAWIGNLDNETLLGMLRLDARGVSHVSV